MSKLNELTEAEKDILRGEIDGRKPLVAKVLTHVLELADAPSDRAVRIEKIGSRVKIEADKSNLNLDLSLDKLVDLQSKHDDLLYEIQRTFEAVYALKGGRQEPLTLEFGNDYLSSILNAIRDITNELNEIKNSKEVVKKTNYQTNDRVEYYVFRNKKKAHRIGYVKARKTTLFGVRYYVCVADHSREIDIVKASQIFGISDYTRKNFKKNKTEKENED